MTSADMMKRILAGMPDRVSPMSDLVAIFERSEGRLRSDLMVMADLGLVEKVEIDIPGKKTARCRVGWRKTVRI